MSQGKKNEIPDFKKLEASHAIIGQSIVFLSELHTFIDEASVSGLTGFIDKYKVCGVDSFARYARGLEADFEAVKNAILNRSISNGPIEGINNLIKLLRRIRYGRSGTGLINAVAVLHSAGTFRYSDYTALKARCSTKNEQGNTCNVA